MTSITDVILMCWDYVNTQTYPIWLFGQYWEFTILQWWFVPVIAGLTIAIVKHIYRLVTY